MRKTTSPILHLRWEYLEQRRCNISISACKLPACHSFCVSHRTQAERTIGLKNPEEITVQQIATATEAEKLDECLTFIEGTSSTEVRIKLDTIRAFEFRTALKSVSSQAKCTLIEALSHLVHGIADFEVTHNLYCPLTDTIAL